MKKMSIGEVFREAFRIFSLHIGKIFRLTLMIVLPVNALNCWFNFIMNDDGFLNTLYEALADGTVTDSQLAEVSSRMLPYIVIFLILAALEAVFTLSIIMLTADEGTHGALGPSYLDGDIYVCNEGSGVVPVESATEYLARGIKLLPAYALTVLIGSLMCLVGIFFILPALFFALLTVISVYGVALKNTKGMPALKAAMRIMIFSPSLILYSILPSIINYLFSLGVQSLLSALPISDTAYLIILAAVSTVLTFGLSFFTIVPSVAFSNRFIMLEEKYKETKQ